MVPRIGELLTTVVANADHLLTFALEVGFLSAATMDSLGDIPDPPLNIVTTASMVIGVVASSPGAIAATDGRDSLDEIPPFEPQVMRGTPAAVTIEAQGGALLTEGGDHLLTEGGDRILLEGEPDSADPGRENVPSDPGTEGDVE